MTAETKGEPVATPQKFTPLSYQELLDLKISPLSWIVPLMIPTPGLVVITGRPGSFKTFFALWLCLRASAGLPLFENMGDTFFPKPQEGLQSEPTPSLFIEEENTIQTIKERVRGFKGTDSNSFFLIDGGFKFNDKTSRTDALHFIEEKGIKLLVLDPFSSVMGLENENDNAEASRVMDIIRKEFVTKGLTVILIHHPSKGDGEGRGIRGAGDILGKCDVHLCLETDSADEKIIRVNYEKLRIADRSLVSNFKMRLTGDTFSRTAEFIYLEETKSKKENEKMILKDQIMEAMADGEEYQRQQIADLVDHSSTGKAFDSAWKELITEKRIVQNMTTKKYHNGEPKIIPLG
ncbi:MAG: AAA family ATPase [Patescibacteria group bacterium]